MSDDSGAFVAGLIIGVFFGVVFTSLIWSNHNHTLKKEAIEHSAAQHNPKTGEFEWLK